MHENKGSCIVITRLHVVQHTYRMICSVIAIFKQRNNLKVFSRGFIGKDTLKERLLFKDHKFSITLAHELAT